MTLPMVLLTLQTDDLDIHIDDNYGVTLVVYQADEDTEIGDTASMTAGIILMLEVKKTLWTGSLLLQETIYSEDSITGTPLVQSLVSHLHQNPTYEVDIIWYCGFWFYRDSPIYIRLPFKYRPTYRVLTVVCIYSVTLWKDVHCRNRPWASCQ